MNPLYAAQHGSELWLRPEGKGTFQSSPAIQEVATAALKCEVNGVTIDLSTTQGMDSTFMGMLAGLAKVARKKGGRIRIVGAKGQNEASLEELGLDVLLEISESNPDDLELRREELALVDTEAMGPGQEDHILECHENLCEADGRNKKTFKAVLEVLRQSAATT